MSNFSHVSPPLETSLLLGSHSTCLFLSVILIFISLFLAVLGLHCCTAFSPVAVSRSYSLDAAHRLLIAEASLAAEYGP